MYKIYFLLKDLYKKLQYKENKNSIAYNTQHDFLKYMQKTQATNQTILLQHCKKRNFVQDALPFQENNRNLDVDNYKITRDIKNNIKKIFYKVQDSNSLKYLIKSIFIYFVYRNDSKNDKDIVKVFTSRNKIYEPGGKHEIFKQALNCKNLDMYLKTICTINCISELAYLNKSKKVTTDTNFAHKRKSAYSLEKITVESLEVAINFFNQYGLYQSTSIAINDFLPSFFNIDLINDFIDEKILSEGVMEEVRETVLENQEKNQKIFQKRFVAATGKSFNDIKTHDLFIAEVINLIEALNPKEFEFGDIQKLKNTAE